MFRHFVMFVKIKYFTYNFIASVLLKCFTYFEEYTKFYLNTRLFPLLSCMSKYFEIGKSKEL